MLRGGLGGGGGSSGAGLLGSKRRDSDFSCGGVVFAFAERGAEALRPAPCGGEIREVARVRSGALRQQRRGSSSSSSLLRLLLLLLLLLFVSRSLAASLRPPALEVLARSLARLPCRGSGCSGGCSGSDRDYEHSPPSSKPTRSLTRSRAP